MTIARTGSASARASGAVTLAAAVLSWLVAVPVKPAASAARDRPSQMFAGNATVVCVGSDGILRAAGPANACAPGQTPIPLARSTSEGDDVDPWNPQDEPDSATPAALDDLSALEARLKALENGPLFEVVDQNGRAIFQVRPGKVLLSNDAGDQVIELRATNAVSSLTARNRASQEISLGTSGDVGGVLVTEGGVKRIEFGKQQAGNFSLRLPGVNGSPLAAIGESQAGSGALVVGDVWGRPKALVSVLDGKGSITIRNGNDAPVLAMTEGATGAGLFVIGDAQSEPMVKFSVTEDRYGAVLTGPVAGFPMVPGSGMPGSYILGCAGGASCGPGGGRR